MMVFTWQNYSLKPKHFLFLIILAGQFAIAQQPYYNGIDFSQNGTALYNALQQRIENASTTFTYGDVRDALKIIDENPQNTQDVLLVYGFNDSDGNCQTDRSRDKDDFGGNTCQYNREHVFARSLADPTMGSVGNSSTGIGADPHNLRASDAQMNSNKGSRKFADGSGNAGIVGSGHWYPGDEWKGDVARMLMYMYTRYGTRCAPSLTGEGSLQSGTQMLQLFLEWNAEDPVSPLEDQRNPYLESVYGNRNPFIDNPYLATKIWGGPQAEDRWNLLNNTAFTTNNYTIAPNPSNGQKPVVYPSNKSCYQEIGIYQINGQKMYSKQWESCINSTWTMPPLTPGVYFLEIRNEQSKQISKVVITAK